MKDNFTKAEARGKAQEARALEGLRARKSSIDTLMLTVMGRRFIWDELSAGNVFAQTYVAGSFDGTAFQEGQRSSALRLLADVVRYAPNAYILMTKENSPVKLDETEEQEQDEDNG